MRETRGLKFQEIARHVYGSGERLKEKSKDRDKESLSEKGKGLAEICLHARHLFDAAGNKPRHLRGGAVAAVIKNQDV